MPAGDPDDPKPAPKKRHLPILQERADPTAAGGTEKDGADKEEDRPAWRRVSIGTTATFLVWLPLLFLVEHLTDRGPDAEPAAGSSAVVLVAHTAVFCLAAFAGGAVTGRIGADKPRREGALAGASAALIAWLLTLSQGARGGILVWALLLVILVSLGAGAGTLGGRTGARLRSI